MSAGALHTWIKRRITVRRRLGRICTAYLLFLMVVTHQRILSKRLPDFLDSIPLCFPNS